MSVSKHVPRVSGLSFLLFRKVKKTGLGQDLSIASQKISIPFNSLAIGWENPTWKIPISVKFPQLLRCSLGFSQTISLNFQSPRRRRCLGPRHQHHPGPPCVAGHEDEDDGAIEASGAAAAASVPSAGAGHFSGTGNRETRRNEDNEGFMVNFEGISMVKSEFWMVNYNLMKIIKKYQECECHLEIAFSNW